VTGNLSSSTATAVASRYVIVTPAHNEAALIGRTIDSVVSQTTHPQRWLIVDDGSTDDTAAIVKQAAAHHPFIDCLYRDKPAGQDYFASNVHAIMLGYRRLTAQPFDFLAILDADIVLPPDYYQQILARFAGDPQLGVASGIYENLVDGKLRPALNDRRSTPKAIQVFRREVFEQIGGFLPLKYGGEDTIACVMARMHGWKAWSFPELKVIHLRPTGTGAAGSLLKARFRQGVAEYHLAAHPLFFVLKAIRRMMLEPPLLLGGCARLVGYLTAALRRETRDLPEHVIRQVRSEQVARMLSGNRIPNSVPR
jgi:poly-beta-1,6-N-acetyl-D-glucosamine synthase